MERLVLNLQQTTESAVPLVERGFGELMTSYQASQVSLTYGENRHE